MIFRSKNTLLPPSWFEKAIIDTLKLYEHKKDITNSPLIKFMRNWNTTGGMHLECYQAPNYEESIIERQKRVIQMYEDIKNNGYMEQRPILVTFDSEGYMKLYDGHHRLSILKYLGMEVELTVSTEWKGAVDGMSGQDFPLFETLEKIHNGKRYLYQWVDDPRLKDLPCSRPDAKARLEYLLKHLQGKTVLDIGCSEGYFTNELAKRGYDVVGVDINPNLVSIARYLGAIQGLKAHYRTGDWREAIREYGHFDNIIYFSVLHNNINSVGEKKAFDDLELFRGKTERMFVEIPDINVQKDWAYIFSPDKFDRALEVRTKLNIQEKWIGYRPILLLTTGNKTKKKTKRIAVKTNGYKMYVPEKDYVSESLFKYGTWEPATTKFIKEHLKEGQTFVDVGGQAGYYTLLASKIVGPTGKVDTFEPLKENRKLIMDNIKLNKLHNIAVHQEALSSENGEVKLYRRWTPGQASIVKTSDQYDMVNAIKYSDKYDVPDMIKIDVEGAEKQVLEGMTNVLTTKKPVYIIIEDWYNHVTDWLISTYGFKLITTERGYGNRILAKNIEVETVIEPLRIHLLGTFNTPTTLKDEGVGNAFSSKVVRMAKILKKLGYYVIFYGVEGSDVECDEFVQVSSREILEKTYGKWEKDKIYGCGFGDLAHKTFNENTIREINKRKFFGDFLLCCYGNYQKQIADAVKIPDTVEIGIGYTGSFARFRIFESYYMMNYTYGAEKKGDVNFYNTVIPGFFEEADFEYSKDKDDYFLYLGRIVKRKGVLIAKQVAEKLGKKLVVAGFASRDNKWDIAAYEEVIKSPNVEFVGFAGVEKRKQLMSKAKAVFMPTTYLEPFGYVAVEAMMSGTPVITTDGGAFNETVLHGVTGYRCRSFEEFLWATQNIDKIKPEDCRKWAMENYSMETATKRYKEYFEQILRLYGKGWYADNPTRSDLDYRKIKL